MSLTVLSVAYPLAPVGPDAVGGAEQVLSILDRALVAAGHHSIVVASEGSVTAGQLVPTPAFPQTLDDNVKRAAEGSHGAAIARVLSQQHVDLVHMHALNFDRFLPDARVPVLASLHLPLQFYSHEALHPQRPQTWLHCVSEAQQAGADRAMPLLPPIPNGVELARFGGYAKRRFALFLGRICPEKGVHLAIEACRAAGLPLLIGGRVFAYEAHLDYFEQEIEPHLGRDVRFLGPLGAHARRRILSMAQCLLVPSLIEETSSLVAREAAASGTAVVAFRRGALIESVVNGVTGYLVEDVPGMSEAITSASRLDPAACRRHAEERFDAAAMVEGYFAAYRTILSR